MTLAGRSPAAFDRQMMEMADTRVIFARQSSNVVLNQDGTINMTAWDEEATTACNSALSALPQASNPSGTCVCYNLPALNNATGTFEADLRLYQLSEPTGQFTGIPPQNIQVGLAYHGASVSPVSANTAAKKVITPVKRQAATTNQNLKLLQTYLFVGEIDKDRMTDPMTMAELQALVMPTITLSGVNSAGQSVSTNVSSNEAVFVAGVFSQEVFLSDTAKAQAAVDTIVSRMQNGTVAFVLPGVQFLIFPVGLVVTGVWLVIGLAVIGLGFFERVNYRESYRRRSARAGKGTTTKRI